MIKGEVIRWGLLAFGAILGLVLAFIYGWSIYHFRGPPARDSFAQMALILGCCAMWYAVTYNVGIRGHRLFGMKREVEEVHRQRRWHMLSLNILLLLIMIAAWIFE